jgi:PAS domain S-box-containing protein
MDNIVTLRNRIFRAFLIAVIPIFILIIVAVEMMLLPKFEEHTKKELTDATSLLCNSVRTGANVAIRNHLKAIAEQNREIINHYYSLIKQGVLDEEEAFLRLRNILLNQKIGSSGYLYCINSEGYVVLHPSPGVENTYQTDFLFVREQMKLKEGYIEYDWKNPEEEQERPKALYMVYFEPLDWIISVSSYRSEFSELIESEDFRDNVMSLKFGEQGYAYMIDSTGTTLIHPELERYDFFAENPSEDSFVQKILTTGKGTIEYEWGNPSDPKPLKKIAVYESIPEFGWVIVSSAYLDEIFQPARILRSVIYGGLLVLFFTVFFSSLLISKRLTKPLDKIMLQLDQKTKESNYSILEVSTNDEIGRLAGVINKFINEVEKQKKDITIEREKYQHLFQTSPTGIFLLQDFVIIDCNPATCEIFGGTYQEIVGKSIIELSKESQNSEKTEDVAYRLINQTNNQYISSFEWEHKRLNGELFSAEVQLKQFSNTNGHSICVAFIRDFTERKEFEQKLAESQRMLRRVIDTIPVRVFWKDREGRYLGCNLLFAQDAGRNDYESMIGDTDYDMGWAEQAELYRADDFEVISSGRAKINYEEPQTTPEGRDIWLNTSKIPLKDENGHIYGILGTYEDITVRKQAETQIKELNEHLEVKVLQRTAELNEAFNQIEESNLELKQLNEELAIETTKLLFLNEKLVVSEQNLSQANQTKDKFFSIIAHDLRNPVAALYMNIELLEIYFDRFEKVELRNKISKLHETSIHLKELVDNLLQWSGSQTKRFEFTPELLSLRDIINSNLVLFNILSKDKNINIANKIENTDIKVLADSNMLNTILRNLISNAIKFTPVNGYIEIGSELDTETNMVNIYIKDNGIGISELNIQKLFGLNENLTTIGTTGEKGTGLGLLLCKEFVERHGGKIWVESQEGKGSTFYFTLPIGNNE